MTPRSYTFLALMLARPRTCYVWYTIGALQIPGRYRDMLCCLTPYGNIMAYVWELPNGVDAFAGYHPVERWQRYASGEASYDLIKFLSS